MNVQQQHVLSLRDTDTEGALRRMNGNGQLYDLCLDAFLRDRTVEELNEYVDTGGWDEAFTSAHALKGVAGNMGFIPLMHASAQLIVLLRGGRINELGEWLEQINSCHRDIIDAIHQYFALADEEHKGETV